MLEGHVATLIGSILAAVLTTGVGWLIKQVFKLSETVAVISAKLDSCANLIAQGNDEMHKLRSENEALRRDQQKIFTRVSLLEQTQHRN